MLSEFPPYISITDHPSSEAYARASSPSPRLCSDSRSPRSADTAPENCRSESFRGCEPLGIACAENTPMVLLLEAVPLNSLDPEGLAMLESIAASGFDANHALSSLVEGQKACCLAFVDSDDALTLLDDMGRYEQGLVA